MCVADIGYPVFHAPERRGSMLTIHPRLSRALLFMVACTAAAPAQIHPAEPAVNLGDTSFLDALGGPGLLIEEIADGTRSGKVADSAGQTLASTPAGNSISGITHVAWLSKRRLFGAWTGVEVLESRAQVNAGKQGSANGWGDLTVTPLILQWKEWKITSIRLQQRIVFDFDLPVGEYRRDSNVNVSSHADTVHPYYAVTAFFGKHWETSWRIHYLWNSTNHAPPLASRVLATQAGQAVHFNATIGYALPHGFWIGANGYFLKQVTDPNVNGMHLLDSPEQVGAIGPGAVWDLGKFMLYANAYHEVGAMNRPEGDKIVLRVQWLPGRKGRST